jgi:hypothetical protein
VCVLGSEAARRFGASGEVCGSLVKVGGNWYRVIGVLAAEFPVGAEGAGEGTNPGRETYLPITNTFGATTASFQNVRSRIREIAVRRAVWARRSEVLAQFVLEGVILASLGAVLGIAAGIVGSGVTSWMSDWAWMLSPIEAALTFAVAITIAVSSTLYPSAYAATLDPVVALRLER